MGPRRYLGREEAMNHILRVLLILALLMMGALSAPAQERTIFASPRPAPRVTAPATFALTLPNGRTLLIGHPNLYPSFIVQGGGGGSPSFSAITSGTNTTATMLVGTGASLGTTGSGSISATNTSAVDGVPVIITAPAEFDGLRVNGAGELVNFKPGLPCREDSDGTAALLASDNAMCVLASNATANAVSIAQAGTAGFEAAYYVDLVCPAGAGTCTVTPATSTINGQPTLAIPGNSNARILSFGGNYLAFETRSDVTVQLVVFDFTTAVATGDGKFYFLIPAVLDGKVLVGVTGQVITASSSGTPTVQLARCAATATGNACSGTVVDMLSTLSTIDANENSTDTAATPAVINAANATVTKGQLIRVDVDVAGTGTQGMIYTLRFR